MRRARRILALAALLVVLLGAGLLVLLQTSLPQHAGTIAVPGLQAAVTVRRDDHGVPYIRAENERDGTFALGFVHAQDRLWQMELRRRVGAGRLAELIGRGGLPIDRFMRLMRFHSLAEAGLDALSPEARDRISAYTEGVNAYLATRRRPLPPEFWLLWHRPEPWTDADSVVAAKLMALDLAGNWRQELLRAQLARDVPAQTYRALFPSEVAPDDATLAALGRELRDLDLDGLAALAGPPPPSGHGSNAWVVAPERTGTGGAVLANDPHLDLTSPGMWYLAGLETPETEVVGATLPGLPVFVLGRTDRIAWGMTNTGSDVQDLVIEQLLGTPPTATRTPDGEAPLATFESTIVCRFCEDERFVARWSVNGPLVSDLVNSARDIAGADRALALRWTALRGDDAPLEAGFALPHVRDWAGFDAALEAFTNPQQNVVYADVAGHIGLVSPGLVPIRRAGDGTLPVPGWEARGQWSGFIPYDELPRRVDPPQGRLANANNALVDAHYPYLLSGDWDVPFRYRRIIEKLDEAPHDVARARALQSDVRSGLAHALLPLFAAAEPLAEEPRRWRDRLVGWDREADVASREATVFAAWYAALPDHLYADELGPLFERYGRDRPRFIERTLSRDPSWCDDVRTAEVETCPLVLARSLEAALARLLAELGPEGDAWAWGAQHPAIFPHDVFGQLGPLAAWAELRFPAGGDDTTVNAASHGSSAKPPLFPARHGAGYRQIVDLAAPERSRFVAPTGQVGHPWSPHYRDLAGVWRAGDDLAMSAPTTAAGVLRLERR